MPKRPPRIAELQQQIDHLRAQRAAVADVLRAVARSEGLQVVFDEIVDGAKRLCGGEHAQLFVADGDVFRVVGTSGGKPRGLKYAQEHPHARDRTTVVGRVALTRDLVQIPDVLADPDYDYGGQRIARFRALLGVPIELDGELIGAVAVGRSEPGAFPEEQVQVVRTFADQAAIAIANARLLDAVERQRTELARFLSPQVAELVSSPGGERLLAGHRAYIACLFCDLRNFTAFAESAAPEDLLDVLRGYHAALGALLPQFEGTLEHFAGDGLMIFFNDPLPVEEHELKAVGFAVAAREAFAELARVWKKRGTDLGLGIGIEAGYATLGRIGYEGRYDYGAVSPVTNLASRLSTRAAAMQILVGPRLFAAVEDDVDASPVGDLELKGFARAFPAYEIRDVRRRR